MDNPFAAREIWFLTGSQGLYGPETLDQVAEQSRVIAQTLDAASDVPVKIVWKPVLTSRDAIRETALAANSDPACVGVIAWMHTFSPAKMWILGLDALQTPLLHLHTQANEKLPWSSIDMDFMNLNQAAHGDREFGYIASRLGVERKTVVGHASHADVQQRIGRWARAATGWAELHSLRLARFGDNMRDVAVTEGDKTEAELGLGVSVNTWGVNDLVEVVDGIEESAIDELVAVYDAEYDVVPELQEGGERRESLRYGARLELGLRSFLEEGGFGAFTTNFEDLGGLRQLPGLPVQRLMADGYGFGAEGDWKTAILVRVANVMGFGLPGGASLMEDYTYELTPGEQKILGAHMLEVSPSLTTARPRLEIHPLGIGDREDPVRLTFTADPGPGLVIAMSDMRERFRLVANTVQIVAPDEPLPHLPVACAVWEPAPSLATSAECWLTAGAAHHTVMTTATDLEIWEDLAEISGLELAVIDESTTVRSFAQELRVNQVFHRLAQGF
ncbi:L-arabinose isomerase [Brachybacterium halotolerans subsp. kimchii]|uniref:L-arabinose isomerase n=1 Tax=Brachybacterium halotolerans TaxID=2795215 RepID=UPI001E5ED789|nr:L-arabinose isomerase [Brachybacterium halotolerans]UEJ81627.1 L-arabinose isomerase [Brachybacterium halotolerans subsp. kimchii]